MQRTSLLTPLSLLASGCVLIVLLITGPQTNSPVEATARNQAYPAATAYPLPAASTTITPTVASTVTTRTAQPTTVQTTPTATLRPTTNSAVTPTVTLAPTVVRTPTPPLTRANAATPITDDSSRSCVPAVPVIISGGGPANAGFLVVFNQRIVSGGTVRSNGTYSIDLIIGNEAAGTYPVEVRVRGSRQLLAAFTCQVPATTPTPVQ